MESLSDKEFETLKTAGLALDAAVKPLRILASVEWDEDQRRRFLKDGKLPNPTYETIDTSESLERVADARRLLDGDCAQFKWLLRTAQDIETTAALLAARGTKDFFRHSKTLYQEPKRLMIDRSTRVIDLAEHMEETLDSLESHPLLIGADEERLSAEDFIEALRPSLALYFADAAPELELSSTISAKAIAGSTRIRVRSSATFSRKDVDQLLQHEALIHVATGLNGKAQEDLPILGRAHSGTTEIQEGLAVFAEMITGAMDPTRFRRLSDRVIAIQMSIDGADFKEVFDYYRERTRTGDDAYDNTRRIFRGGVVTGGAPFTKDIVYLNGLLRVHNFMRSVVSLGRADLIRILFSGKMDLEDIPALAQLSVTDRLRAPKFMPAWATDLRFLVSYMAYSSFLNQVKMPGFQAYYQKALTDVPIVWDFGRPEPD